MVCVDVYVVVFGLYLMSFILNLMRILVYLFKGYLIIVLIVNEVVVFVLIVFDEIYKIVIMCFD